MTQTLEHPKSRRTAFGICGKPWAKALFSETAKAARLAGFGPGTYNGTMKRNYGQTSPQLAEMLAKLPPERVARAKAFQGKRLNWFEPRTVVVCVLTKVNAPCRRQLNAEELAGEIRAGNINLTQVDSFYTEIDVDAQRIFAAELGIPEDILLRTAKALAKRTHQDLPLLAT